MANYGEADPVQSAENALTDPQLRNLSPALADFIARYEAGLILDLGCGEGILLRRLAEIDSFRKQTGWMYVAADYPEKLEQILVLAAQLRLHRQVDVIELDKLYREWFTEPLRKLPCFVVVRNVFHELDITETAQLLFRLVTSLKPEDVFVAEDLQVLPEAERGNACWHPELFEELLQNIGFSTSRIDEVSSRGNRWFMVTCRLTENRNLTFELLVKVVSDYRQRQFDLWAKMDALFTNVPETRRSQVALADFDLQRGALQLQLARIHAPGVSLPSDEEQARIAKAVFARKLNSYDFEALSKSIVPVPRPANFRDRARDQDNIEEFLWSDSHVLLVRGGPFMGKSVLVEEVLARRAHDRQVLLIDLEATFGIWNLLERYLAGLSCLIPHEILNRFRALRFQPLQTLFAGFVENLASRTIVVFDHFERLLDPNGNVQDAEIRQFLTTLAGSTKAKVIITTQREPKLEFIKSNTGVSEVPFPIGRFPEGNHVQNVLDDYVNRAELQIRDYPEELYFAIDRYPYLAVLAARIIRVEGKSALSDSTVLESLRSRLRDELIRRILSFDERARAALECLSLLRIAVPRRMFEGLVGVESVRAAEDLGLLYPEFDRVYPDLLTGADVLRGEPSEDEEGARTSTVSESGDVAPSQRSIADWYARLYREHDDPRWLRELHYHTLLTGDEKQIEFFGIEYRHELFLAGNYWFRALKNFRLAFRAFEAARSLGLRTYLSEMRFASCSIRVGKRAEGEALYRELLDEFPTAKGLKTSYVDSLLYVQDYPQALSALERFQLHEEDDPWVAHQYGRTYFGLHRYEDAVRAFNIQLKQEPIPAAFWRLAQAYRRLGKRQDVGRILLAGLKRYKTNRRLELGYGAHLASLGAGPNEEEAEIIFRDLYSRYGADGAVLQQLCKLLCKRGRTQEAARIYEKEKRRIYPERYERAIQTEILIARKDWRAALKLLEDVDPKDDHAIGLKLKLYLNWAREVDSIDEQQQIAEDALMTPMDLEIQADVPVLVMLCRLALMAENSAAFNNYIEKLEKINSTVAGQVRAEEDILIYWEDDISDT